MALHKISGVHTGCARMVFSDHLAFHDSYRQYGGKNRVSYRLGRGGDPGGGSGQLFPTQPEEKLFSDKWQVPLHFFSSSCKAWSKMHSGIFPTNAISG